ncbi:MAG TPA: SMP-30/gluconolactonase/LRE family protein [Terriglobales bacterium]|jgi:DNA-binding beta-propeller fold protein YncE
MCKLCAKTTSVRMAAIFLLFAWGLTLASPVALHAGNKKKKQVTATQTPAQKKPQQDLSKLVWPEPPNIPRVRYTSYFAGMKFDKEADSQGKKAKQTWMDRLAGTQSQDEKVTMKNFPFQLLGPYGMSVDSKGRLYVADQKVGAIFIFNTETKETEMIRNGFEAHFGMINGVAVDDNDRVFVSDGKLGKVLVFNAKHQVEDQIKDLVDPVGLAIDKENRLLYVVDTQQDQVLVYDADSLKPIRKIGTAGKKHTLTTPGDFALPSDVALDKDGNVYVTDTLNWRVEIFDAEGKFVSQFGKHCDAIGCFERPKGIAVDGDGHIWVVDTSLNLVQAYDRDGALLAYVGSPGRLLGQFTDPVGIFIDQNNRMFVSEQYPWGRVQEFRYITDAEAEQLKKEKAASHQTTQAEATKPVAPPQAAAVSPEVKK